MGKLSHCCNMYVPQNIKSSLICECITGQRMSINVVYANRLQHLKLNQVKMSFQRYKFWPMLIQGLNFNLPFIRFNDCCFCSLRVNHFLVLSFQQNLFLLSKSKLSSYKILEYREEQKVTHLLPSFIMLWLLIFNFLIYRPQVPRVLLRVCLC